MHICIPYVNLKLNLTFLLLLDGKLCLVPGVPSSFEDINLFKPFLDEFPCHPGTRRFVNSGAIEDKGLLLRVLIHP